MGFSKEGRDAQCRLPHPCLDQKLALVFSFKSQVPLCLCFRQGLSKELVGWVGGGVWPLQGRGPQRRQPGGVGYGSWGWMHPFLRRSGCEAGCLALSSWFHRGTLERGCHHHSSQHEEAETQRGEGSSLFGMPQFGVYVGPGGQRKTQGVLGRGGGWRISRGWASWRRWVWETVCEKVGSQLPSGKPGRD